VLSDDTCAVYSSEPHSERGLKLEFAELMSSATMQHYVLESVTVKHSFDLQIAVQRLLGPSESEPRVSQQTRIH
jgi:hypothetical protein